MDKNFGKMEMHEKKNGKHYFQFVASNGRVLCQSDDYADQAGAKNGLDVVVSIARESLEFEEVED